MRRFSFRLERALEIRGLKRLLAEENLGRCLRSEHHAKSALQEAEEAREGLHKEMRSRMAGRVDPRSFRGMALCREHLSDEVFRREAEVKRKEALTGIARGEAVSRTQEERTLERLREDRLKEHKFLYWKDQGKKLDEIGSARFEREERRDEKAND